MKYVFLSTKAKDKVEIDPKILSKLPAKIGLATTVQYIDQIEAMVAFLRKNGKEPHLVMGRHTRNKGQVLGCDTDTVYSVEKDVDAFLYVGDGLFHPKMMVMATEKPVFIFNPHNKEFWQLKRSEVEKLLARKKAALMKFYASRNIGIIVSTKFGQQNLKGALQAKKELEKQGKRVYVMVCETLDFREMENFPFVEVWVNTMCARIGLDDTERTPRPLVNLAELPIEVKNIFSK